MNGIRKTIDQYKEEIKNLTFLCLSDFYINNKTKLTHQCKICNTISDINPAHVLRGIKCSKCVGGVLITHLDYVSRLEIQESDYRPIEPYINSKTFIQHKCQSCNNVIKIQPKNASRHLVCKCHKERKYNTDWYKSRLIELKIFHIPLEEYTRANDKILHRCGKCSHEWMVKPGHIMYFNGCPSCDKTGTKTHEQYLEEIKYQNILPLENYINAYTKINHQCLICNHEWLVKPGEILYNKTGCPHCSMSKGETFIKGYLQYHNILFETQKTYPDLKMKSLLRYDFYIPDKNLLIEYNGIQHYESNKYFDGDEGFENTQISDSLKLEYALSNNIKLLVIPYTNTNVEIESILNNNLNR